MTSFRRAVGQPDALALPRAARLVAWGNAYLGGLVDLDQVTDAVVEEHDWSPPVADGPGSGGAWGSAPSDRRPDRSAAARTHPGTAVDWKHWLTAQGAGGRGPVLRLLLPVPGDPGWAAPALASPAASAAQRRVLDALSSAAEVVLGDGEALIPDTETYGPHGDTGTAVRWYWLPGAPDPAPSPGLAEADRTLRATLVEAAHRLASPEQASWRPESAGPATGQQTAAALAQVRAGQDRPLPTMYPQRAQHLASQATRVRVLVQATGSEGDVALGAHGQRAREQLWRELDTAARQALVAACGALLEPQPTSLRS